MKTATCFFHVLFQHTAARRRLEQQSYMTVLIIQFQHTAARRRLGPQWADLLIQGLFQHTAARRRLVEAVEPVEAEQAVSTHSRPKAAGYLTVGIDVIGAVSTHSRPKAAGLLNTYKLLEMNCFNTQPPEGGWLIGQHTNSQRQMFQHTAARRRLGHSAVCLRHLDGFNTQPPEGGWALAGGQ